MPLSSPSHPLRHIIAVARPALLGVAAALGVASAFGQTPPPAPVLDAAAQAAERQQREQQDRQREELRRARESVSAPTTIETPDAPRPRVKPSVAVKRDIRELRIEGATKMKRRFHNQLVQRYQGRAIGIDDLEQLLTEITQYYLRRGYVTTRAYVPDQDLGSGVLRILVVEGRVERLDAPTVSGNIFPTQAGDLLNLRDLEQGIDNLNRARSHRATLDLAPGETPGGTVVVVRDQRSRPWYGSVSLDNTGTAGTGKEQISATVGADDALGFGETASVTHRRSLEYHRDSKASQSTTGSLNVPWGYQSISLGGSASTYALTILTPSGNTIPFSGESQSAFARTDRVLFRGRTARLNGYAQLTWRATRSFFSSDRRVINRRDSAIGEIGASWSQPLAGGFAHLDASVSRGLDLLGATRDPAGLPDFAPRNEFTTLKLTGSWAREFTFAQRAFNYSGSLTGQLTPDVLHGSEQLTIGGIYAVRGFDETNLAGDKGLVWRNDLSTTFRVPLGGPGKIVAVRPYVGIDYGRAWTNVRGSAFIFGPKGSLVGGTAGVGVNFRRYTADVSYARSLHRAASMPRESGHVYFRVNASF